MARNANVPCAAITPRAVDGFLDQWSIIDDKLGDGSQGVVLKARSRRSHHGHPTLETAVKVMNAEAAKHEIEIHQHLLRKCGDNLHENVLYLENHFVDL